MKIRNNIRRSLYLVGVVLTFSLGLLLGGCDSDEEHPDPWVRPSALGEKVLSCWHAIPTHFPEVRVIDVQLMPDHLHGVFFVTRQVPYHLGKVVNGFKVGCNVASRELLGSTLWEEGYHDRILVKEGQLETMIRYLNDNPRRLWTKRHHPESAKQL